MEYLYTKKALWVELLERLLASHDIFGPVAGEHFQEYEHLTAATIPEVVYNRPKPASPLKIFFLPVRENVTSAPPPEKQRIIIGVPACDTEALGLLDEIYLDSDFEDIFYRRRRQNTIIISSDCFDVMEHCHCTSYGIKPWDEKRSDAAVAVKGEMVFIRIISEKGRKFINDAGVFTPVTDTSMISFIDSRHRETESMLERANSLLPGYSRTGRLVKESGQAIWVKHSATCVSCGACTTICPTCTCFLLIDKPGFHKVKQMDACQYPGFERTAGGEDPLVELHERFRNRYMCKYVWKPEKFHSIACTGCGRCIEACIGKIDKNKLFMELAK
ncbi:MAG: hypothetical protein GYA43_05940 [Bacteroidales bacterium]|nr:hypothetical protein [Bacteroidales bacterium]